MVSGGRGVRRLPGKGTASGLELRGYAGTLSPAMYPVLYPALPFQGGAR